MSFYALSRVYACFLLYLRLAGKFCLLFLYVTCICAFCIFNCSETKHVDFGARPFFLGWTVLLLQNINSMLTFSDVLAWILRVCITTADRNCQLNSWIWNWIIYLRRLKAEQVASRRVIIQPMTEPAKYAQIATAKELFKHLKPCTCPAVSPDDNNVFSMFPSFRCFFFCFVPGRCVLIHICFALAFIFPDCFVFCHWSACTFLRYIFISGAKKRIYTSCIYRICSKPVAL